MTTDHLAIWRTHLDTAPHLALRAARELSEPLRSSCSECALASARALMTRADREHGSRTVDSWCAVSDEARETLERRAGLTRPDLADYIASALAIGAHREPIVSDAIMDAMAIGYCAALDARDEHTLTCLLMALDAQGLLDHARVMRSAGAVSLIGAHPDDLIIVDVGAGRLRIQLASEI